MIKSICVYCGSSDLGPRSHREAARRLGRLMAGAGVELVFGGGRVGLMGAVADAVLEAGGRAVGIIPHHLLRAEVGHARVSELIVVDSMHVRKQTMFERADAFVVLPGGPGTLDETFEVLTWRQLRLHDKPIVLVDVEGYWQPFLALIDAIIAAGYARDSFRAFLTVVAGVDAVLPTLAAAPAPTVEPAPERL